MTRHPGWDLTERIRQLPKAELHRHLSGAVRFSTLLELAQKHGQNLPASTPQALEHLIRQYAQKGNLREFLKAWRIINRVTADAALREPEIYSRLIYEATADAYLNETICYLELRLVPPCLVINHKFHEMEFRSALRAIKVGIQEARREFPTLVRIIFSLPRDFLAKQTQRFLDTYYDILLQGVADHGERYVVGFDLAGDEANGSAGFFRRFFRQVKDLGYKVTIHAGEAAGPQSIRDALELAGADRIGHGVSAVRDTELMSLLAERRIPVEICITSNVATGAVRTLEDHPVRTFCDAGLLLTINADDPSVLSTDLNKEFGLLLSTYGFSTDELVHLARNAMGAAFCTPQEKQALVTLFGRTQSALGAN